MNTGRASNTGRGSDIIVLIEAGGFYSRKYGNMCPSLIEIGSKMAEKNSAQTNRQTDRQTNRQKNNGHLAQVGCEPKDYIGRP